MALSRVLHPHMQNPPQIKLCIAGGRHSHLCMLDDSLVCDFSLWTNVEIDSDAKTATVQPGCLWGHVDAACAPYGLAVTGGHDPSTGVAGLTLHGGHGYLERLHGLTVDNLISLEVVSADGTVHKASGN
jgi:FAD/FMN-containing dehydrogenase